MNTLFGNQSIAPFFFIRKYSVFSCSARRNYAVFMDFIDSLAAISFPPSQVYSLFVSFSTLLEVIEQVYYSVLPTVSGKLGTYQYAGPFFTGKVCFVKEGFRMKNAYQIKLNELKNGNRRTEFGIPCNSDRNRTKIPREAFLKYITGEIDREIYFPGVKFACTAISVK